MLCNQQCKVCILCFLCLILEAVSIYCNNPICIFVYNNSIWIHTRA